MVDGLNSTLDEVNHYPTSCEVELGAHFCSSSTEHVGPLNRSASPKPRPQGTRRTSRSLVTSQHPHSSEVSSSPSLPTSRLNKLETFSKRSRDQSRRSTWVSTWQRSSSETITALGHTYDVRFSHILVMILTM